MRGRPRQRGDDAGRSGDDGRDDAGGCMADGDGLGALLDVAAPPVSVDEAEAVALSRFGVAGTARLLTGERDHNFQLMAADGREFVLKFVHPAEDAGVTAFQSAALVHIAAVDPGLPTPRLHLSDTGMDCAVEAQGVVRRVRLLDYLPGAPLHLEPTTAELRRDLGACLARLDLALAGFSHPSDRHPLLWDLQHAARVRPLLDALPAERRGLPERSLDRFEARVVPVLPRLRAQVIHNDFNPHNVLSDGGRIAGIIDFGDMVRAPLVQDLATAAAYQIAAEGPVLAAPGEMIAAFHAVCPLTEDELLVLPDLIAARLMLTIAISSWRAQRHPDNAGYILRNQPIAWRGLARLDALEPEMAVAYLRDVCTRGVMP